MALVIGGWWSYGAHKRLHAEIAQLKARRASKAPVQQVAASTAQVTPLQNYLDAALEAAKQRPGTLEALALLEGNNFDALQANLLIARSIATFKEDQAAAYFDDLAKEVQAHLDATRRTPEGIAYLEEKGEAEFKMACANEVFTLERKIAYVADDSLNPKDPPTCSSTVS